MLTIILGVAVFIFVIVTLVVVLMIAKSLAKAIFCVSSMDRRARILLSAHFCSGGVVAGCVAVMMSVSGVIGGIHILHRPGPYH